MNQENMEWFRKARYGMFVHWGLYSLPAGWWDNKEIPYGTEWIMRNAKIPLSEYKKLADCFNPTDFDAEVWIRKAMECGMKYVVFTAKHHDGFAMYDSAYSDYTIMNTPFKRDIVKELSEACLKYGMIFGIYYSQMQDWEDPDADGNTWDFPDAKNKNFEKYFENKVKPQVKELLTKYGKVGLIWFDTPYDMPKKLCKELEDWVHECQPGCIINGRIGYGYGDYRQMGDNGIPVVSFPRDWETPMTLNDTWGYSKTDENWKSPKKVIHMLTDVVGKGGNLLLNIGPDSLGNIPKGSLDILQTVGSWLMDNGESIYETTPAPDFPYQFGWGGFTYKKNTLFMHVLKNPTFPYEICIVGLKTKVKKVYLLETGEELIFAQSYEIARDECRFRVMFPSETVNCLDMVAVVELEEEPEVQVL